MSVLPLNKKIECGVRTYALHNPLVSQAVTLDGTPIPLKRDLIIERSPLFKTLLLLRLQRCVNAMKRIVLCHVQHRVLLIDACADD